MPSATITSTASTFGTISGTFVDSDSTISGTISGVITGTLDGSVGVPGVGIPGGGTAGQVLAKIDGVDYNTEWVNASGGVWGSITGTLSNQTDLNTALGLKAPLASPALTGVPTAPTAATLTSTTQLATTAFVQQELAAGTAVAKNLEVYVRNQTGSTITAGSIVYISGATGNRPLISLAQANNDANSAQTIGFVKESITNNGFGYVMIRGELENIDTSALSEGAQLYLSPTTAGTWTTTKPYAPQHLVYVGIVIRSHPTQGVILVAVQNGYELDELHNVAAQTPSNNDLLAYETATSLWKNKTFSALGLLTSADAASTYQTLSGMSSYLTTASAASTYLTQANAATTYYPLSGNPSGFLTSAALSGYATESWVTTQLGSYLTTSTAASTYQTQAGMSSYLTTASAASTYAPLASPTFTGTVTIPAGASISGYATTASLSSYAPLASPTFTGVPAAPTAAVDTNTTQLATTAYVVGQGYLKSATASSTYAPLASPTFTGTPSLPTGTTAVTQSAGNNTTAVATTAFVTAAVPSFATETQAIYGTSSTTTISPLMLRHVLANPMLTTYNSLVGNYSSFISGSGAVSTVWSNLFAVQITAANGKAAFQPNSQVAYHSIQSRGKAELTVDWTKPMWFSFRFCYSSASTIGNSNTVNRVTIGKVSSTFGDLSNKGFGVTWTAGTSGAFTVSAHNGTALSSSASSVTVSNTTYFPTTSSAADFLVYSDGAGNVTLYCNGTQVATTTGGPSSGTSPGPRFVFECDNTTSTSGTVTCDYTGVKSMLAY